MRQKATPERKAHNPMTIPDRTHTQNQDQQKTTGTRTNKQDQTRASQRK